MPRCQVTRRHASTPRHRDSLDESAGAPRPTSSPSAVSIPPQPCSCGSNRRRRLEMTPPAVAWPCCIPCRHPPAERAGTIRRPNARTRQRHQRPDRDAVPHGSKECRPDEHLVPTQDEGRRHGRHRFCKCRRGLELYGQGIGEVGRGGADPAGAAVPFRIVSSTPLVAGSWLVCTDVTRCAGAGSSTDVLPCATRGANPDGAAVHLTTRPAPSHHAGPEILAYSS